MSHTNLPYDYPFELTGETKTGRYGGTVRQIRATRDLPHHGVKSGDVGGWVESLLLVDGTVRVSGSAWVGGSAQVVGNALVSDHAVVVGSAWVGCDARVGGSARVGGEAWVGGSAQVGGNAVVNGNAQVGGDAEILETGHCLVVGPIGSEDVSATLARTKGGGHYLSVGCWRDGTLGTLMAEVKRRRARWTADEATQDVWFEQYRALKRLGKVTAKRWAEPETEKAA